MPLNSPIPNATGAGSLSGKLYVVATPIGNREDITLRAMRILKEVHWIAAEDTRHTRRFLQHYAILTRLIAFHEHNESRQAPVLIEKLKKGESIALVSEAGTPGVSDPGFRLIRAAVEAGLDIHPIPGASAAVCALSVSWLPTDSFLFVGFLPKKKGDRIRQIEGLSGLRQALIFYESPRRILNLMAEIQAVLGDRFAVLCREMTKVYEEILRGPLSRLHALLEDRKEIKGECTLLISGAATTRAFSEKTWKPMLREALAEGNRPVSEIAREFAGRHGLSRREVYEAAIKIKDGLQG